jgi:signal transduction histidine kinase
MTALKRSSFWLAIPCLLLLLATGVLLVQGIEALRQAREATTVTTQRLLATEVLLSDLRDAETGQRGYLLTNDSNYLQPYNEALSRLVDSRARLEAQLRRPPPPIDRYQTLGPLIQAKLAELAQSIDLARHGQREQALAVVRSNRGKQIMDDFRAQIAAIRVQAQETIAVRAADEDRLFWRTGFAVAGLGGLAFAIAVALSISLLRISRDLGRRNEQLDLALRAAAAGLWQFDAASGAARWSGQLFTLVGLPEPAAEIGQLSPMHGWRSVIHPDDIAIVEREIGASLHARQPLALEYRVLRPDGKVQWLSVVGRLAEQSASVMNGLAIDITEQKLATQKLVEARTAAAEAGEAKSRFLAAASHDLRQPLQSMFLFAGSLEAYVADGPGRKFFDHLLAGMEALRGLLDRLLNLSRLDAGGVTPNWETFPVGSLIEDLCAAFAPLAAMKGLEFSARPCSATIRSDPTLLGQILRNLISNAITYTERGRIEFSCHASGDRLQIIVRDTGIGIPTEQITRIWDEFHQVGNAARDREQGVGLGLAIVRRLSQLLDHPIRVTSELGKGSCFVVEVPRVAEDEQPLTPCPAAAPPAEGGGRLALIVDDDKMVRDGLRALALAWGYRVVTAASLREALAAIRHGSCPQLLLCDYRLGEGGTGVDVIKQVRERCNSAILSVLITGDTEVNLTRSVAELGVKLLYKPISPDELAQAVRGQAAA